MGLIGLALVMNAEPAKSAPRLYFPIILPTLTFTDIQPSRNLATRLPDPTPSPTPIETETVDIELTYEEPVYIEPEIVYVEVPMEPIWVPATPDTAAMQNYICSVFGNYCSDALIIAQHESGFNQYAISPTNDHGLFQINAYWQQDKYSYLEQLYDPYINTDIAWQIFTGRGYSWSAWYTCKYLPTCY